MCQRSTAPGSGKKHKNRQRSATPHWGKNTTLISTPQYHAWEKHKNFSTPSCHAGKTTQKLSALNYTRQGKKIENCQCSTSPRCGKNPKIIRAPIYNAGEKNCQRSTTPCWGKNTQIVSVPQHHAGETSHKNLALHPTTLGKKHKNCQHYTPSWGKNTKCVSNPPHHAGEKHKNCHHSPTLHWGKTQTLSALHHTMLGEKHNKLSALHHTNIKIVSAPPHHAGEKNRKKVKLKKKQEGSFNNC